MYSFNEFLEVVYLPKIFKANLINNDMYMYNKHNVVLNFFPNLNLPFPLFLVVVIKITSTGLKRKNAIIT